MELILIINLNIIVQTNPTMGVYLSEPNTNKKIDIGS